MDPTPPRILVVDDDPDCIRVMAQILAPLGQARFATNGADALGLAAHWLPDIMLLDAQMPGMSGFELCRRARADVRLRDVPVVFVTSHVEPEFEVAGFQIGAADFITKPVNPALVLARVQAQLRTKAMSDQLRRFASFDPLTGVANRRVFDDSLQCEWRRASRHGKPLALLMVDIDHFKLYNDRHGHPAGDHCLRLVAQAMAGSLQRPGDTLVRYGGEEFAVLLPETDGDGARHVAQALLRAIEALGIVHAASPTALHITASIGAAVGGGEAAGTPDTLLEAADAALYEAKRGGRARVHVRSGAAPMVLA